MTTVTIKDVGELTYHSDYWEGAPGPLGGSFLSIDSPEISADQERRARHICQNWVAFVAQSLAFVEARRSDYGLETHTFTNPNAFIDSGDEWSIYFDTDNEIEAVVGVEFKGETPFQLIIGD